jgi:D-tyrosyl-tRNA(Tyr) deacylase
VESSRKLLARVETGSFRKTMQVELVNDGPVTILLDSRKGF